MLIGVNPRKLLLIRCISFIHDQLTSVRSMHEERAKSLRALYLLLLPVFYTCPFSQKQSNFALLLTSTDLYCTVQIQNHFPSLTQHHIL